MRRFRPMSEEELHVVPGAAKEGPEQFLAVVFAPLLSTQKGKEKVIITQRPKKDPVHQLVEMVKKNAVTLS